MGRLVAALSAGLLMLSGGFTSGFAGQLSVEQSLRNTAERFLSLIDRVENHAGGRFEAADKVVLQDLKLSLAAGHLLLTERMRQRGDLLRGADGKHQERHRLASERYQAAMNRLQSLLQGISGRNDVDSAVCAELRAALLTLAPVQPRPIHGSLPYAHPELAARSPVASPPLEPAYRQPTVAPSLPSDLAAAPEAPISPLIVDQVKAIAEQAGRTHWDPAAIYNWVRENIRTEWYWGCMKGAEETLRQLGGNDADQAALLVAMLRASGYPARYVRGVMEFFPDINSAKAMTGIDDPGQLLGFFRSAGIPHEPVYQGDRLVNIRLEHLWVEALVPYADYRGIVADASGPIWVPLDTSIRAGSATPSSRIDLFPLAGNPLAGFRDRYLLFPREQSPVQLLEGEAAQFVADNFPGAVLADALHVRDQRQLSLGILPGTLQFSEAAVTAEYASLPPELVHQVRFSATAGDEILFDLAMPLHRLSNRKVMVNFLPETVSDQEMINLWGGLDNTPAYLVRLRPSLLVDEESLAVGLDGLAPGESFTLSTEFRSPAGWLAIEDDLVTGYPLLIGIVAQKALPPGANAEAGATDRLYHSALAYAAAWDHDEEFLANLFALSVTRPFPSCVMVGGVLRSEILAGEVINTEWQGLFVDANLRRIAAVAALPGEEARVSSFMEVSGLSGSVHEHRLLLSEYGVDGISTALLLALTRQMASPLLSLDAGNIGELLPALQLEPGVQADIMSAVSAGLRVMIPATPVTHRAWRGVGYLKENPLTGEAGYMLSGGLAGGQTVLGRRDWPADLAALLSEPFTGPPNEDPSQAFGLVAVVPPETIVATAGEEMPLPLTTLVRDSRGLPVAGALVNFTVRSGGGWLIDDRQLPEERVASLAVVSGRDGMARARFVAGERTTSNPVVFVREGDQQANLAGENLLDARLLSGSLAGLSAPIAVFAFAGLPDPNLSTAYGNGLHGEVYSYSGDVLLLLKDRFGNPVANHPVEFSAGSVQPAESSLCRNPPGLAAENRDARLLGDDPCRQRTPVYGECKEANRVRVVSRSDGGALSGVVLGGVPQAAYPVSASFAGILGEQQVSWTHYSHPVPSCSMLAAPENRLVLHYPQRLDAAGHNVDARPAERPALVQAKAYLLAEETAVANGGEPLSCAPLPPLTCDLVAGTGAFTLLPPESVSIDGQPAVRAAAMAGSRELPWLYQGEISLPLGLSEISMQASAVRAQPQIVNSCSGCGTLEPAAAVAVGPLRQTVPIWGVSIEVPSAITALVDAQGIAQRDLRLDYTIKPGGYIGSQAQLLLYRNGELWDTLPSGTSGTVSVNFPAGYWFDPAANYELQVLVNNAGDPNEIRSARIRLLQRTAAVDLRIDGLPDAIEDDIGAFVLVDNDFDEQVEDPSITEPDAVTPSITENDDELKQAWLQIDDSSGQGGGWRVVAGDPGRLRVYHRKDGAWVEFRPTDPPEPVTSFPAVIPLYLEGLTESREIGGDVLTATFYPAGGGAVTDPVPVTVLDIDMAVDGNRDRMIDFQSRQDESTLFWVNNDRDYRHSEDDLPVEDDAETGDDSSDAEISCKRDLEDLTRLHVHLGVAAVPGPLSYAMQVVGDDDKIQPMLNLFPAVNLSDGYLGLPGEGATPDQPDEQLQKRLLIAAGKLPANLPDDSLSFSGENPFLFEGRMPGRGRLLLTASYRGIPVATRSVGLELVDPTWFYDHFVVSQDGVDADSPVRGAVNPEGMAADASRLGQYRGDSDDYVLFVHGWNMREWEKRRWAETVFKRLWWQGYRGKVGLFDWPCRTLPSWDFLVNFDRSEFLAWQSATALGDLLQKLQGRHAGKVRLLAHSQGNVVAGEALRLGAPDLVHTYVASQAALSAGLYESGLPQITDFEPKTPDVMSSYPADTNREPYFAQLSDKVGTIFNYYNAKDYALTGDSLSKPTWLLNNETRPDGSLGYGYQGKTDNYPPPIPDMGFYRDVSSGDPGNDPVAVRRGFPEDCHEIFSFCAQSRTVALGASNFSPGGAAAALNLEGFGFNGEKSSHSRQFRSNVSDEQSYWQRFVRDTAISVIWEGM